MNSKISTRMLTRMALLMALAIIAERVLSIRIPLGGAEGFRLGIGPLPIVFSGIFMGPLAGGLVGALADLVGYFINPIGPFTPHFTITSALRGIIPGLVILLACRRGREVGIFPLFLAVTSMFVLVNILLLPYFQEIVFGLMRAVIVPTKIVEAAVGIPVYMVILFALGKVMNKMFVSSHGEEAVYFSGRLW
ncbi:MAG: folate family ECF transporter S component [Firmicutes bacterium]|nr:folate family ECF transporter S component [Bacillota bacterium]